MPTIRFVKNYPELQVEMGANLMEQLLLAGVPVASSCHGDGICARCRVQIVAGQENISPKTELEKILGDRMTIRFDQRVSCQVKVLGDITVDTTYW